MSLQPYPQSGKQAPEADQKSGKPTWKQLNQRGQSKRGCAANSVQPGATVLINDNYCVNVARDQETVLNVTGKKYIFVDSYQTLNVNLPVANHVLIAGGLP